MKTALSLPVAVSLLLAVAGCDAAPDSAPAPTSPAAETGLLSPWPDSGPPLAWLVRSVGLGYSGPVVHDGVIYVMGSRDGVEQLIALEAATGEELWATDLGEEYENGWGNGPRGTPVVDADRVYALAARGALVCVGLADGAEIWRASLTGLGGSVPTWGYSETPLVDGDLVLATPGGDRGAVAALDKLTGEVRWRSTDATDGAHYSSLVVAEPHGRRQYVQLLPNQLVGLDPADGALLWQVDWPGEVAVIPTPIVRGNQAYVTSGYGVGCMLVEIGPNMTATRLYDNKVMKNHHGGVVLLGDHLYGHSDGVGWVCQEFATGDRVWRERRQLGKGAVTYADGRLYCLSEDEGDVVPGGPDARGLARARPLHAVAANRAAQAAGQDLDPPRDRRRPAVPTRPGAAVLVRRDGKQSRDCPGQPLLGSSSCTTRRTIAPHTAPAGTVKIVAIA